MRQKEKKAEVVGEYLKGGVTLREMERRSGINFRTIHRWVKECEVAIGSEATAEGKRRCSLVAKEAKLPDDVRRLQKELEEARLYNKLLNAMIDIAEEQFEIPIRKKHGAKQR